jgi:ketosteroid isomerase-like protein
MSENLDIVSSIHADWERGDFSATEWLHPDIEFVMLGGPSPGSWSGLAGMAAGTREFLSAWEDYRVEVEEYREIDNERVLVLFHASGRGSTSGLELGQIAPNRVGAALFHIRDGKVTRFVAYWDRGRALADLGLAREGGS